MGFTVAVSSELLGRRSLWGLDFKIRGFRVEGATLLHSAVRLLWNMKLTLSRLFSLNPKP